MWLAVAAGSALLALLGIAVLLGARQSPDEPARPAARAATMAPSAGARSVATGRAPAVGSAPHAAAASPSDAIEALLESDPEQALARISAQSPANEVEAQRLKVLEVRALVALGRIGSARSQAAAYYARWPSGPDVQFLGRLTGRHPTPER